MAFGVVCGPVPDGRSSSAGARRAAPASLPETRRRPAPLTSSSHFDRVFAVGRRRRCGGISVVVAPNEEAFPRVGFVVTKRVGNAVARNRAKRRLRAAAREVEWPSGRDHVVIATPAVLTADFRTLVRWLQQGCGQNESDADEASNRESDE